MGEDFVSRRAIGTPEVQAIATPLPSQSARRTGNPVWLIVGENKSLGTRELELSGILGEGWKPHELGFLLWRAVEKGWPKGPRKAVERPPTRQTLIDWAWHSKLNYTSETWGQKPSVPKFPIPASSSPSFFVPQVLESGSFSPGTGPIRSPPRQNLVRRIWKNPAIERNPLRCCLLSRRRLTVDEVRRDISENQSLRMQRLPARVLPHWRWRRGGLFLEI
jgi:hypothetical protein